MIPASPPHPTRVARTQDARFVELAKRSRKHWLLAVACILLSSGLALIYAKSQTKMYQAVSMIEVDPNAAQPLGDQSGSAMNLGAAIFWDAREYYETQYKIITSDRVLGAVARDLALAADPDFAADAAGGGRTPTLEDMAAKLRPNVEVEPIKNSRLVNLKFTDRDPRRAKRICDEIGSTFLTQNLETAVNATTDAVVWLGGQVDHLRSQLEGHENALYDFKQRNDLASTSINEASNMLRVEMQELDTALTQTRTRKAEVSARQGELSKVPAENPDELPA